MEKNAKIKNKEIKSLKPKSNVVLIIILLLILK